MAHRRTGLGILLFGIGGTLALACGGDDTTNAVGDAGSSDGTLVDVNAPDTATGADTSPPPDTGITDTGADTGKDSGTFDRGPTTLPFNGDPNGVFWDPGVNAALYIADSASNSIQKWTDGAGFSTAATLSPLDPLPDGGAATPTLGQVIRLLDGTLLVTRFGFGQYGALVVVTPNGDAGVLTGIVDGGAVPLSVKKRRIGLAMLADGTIVDTYFTTTPDGGPRVGAVAKVNLIAGTEKDLITGLQKPIGVTQALDGTIVLTDQDFGYMITSPLTGGVFTDPDASVDAGADADAGDAGPLPAFFATLASPDLVCQGPDGTFFAGSGAGTVYQISKVGVVTQFQTGLKSARGCAYDGAHKRLFVVEEDPAKTASAIRIFPVN
jgi:hypothetical protein